MTITDLPLVNACLNGLSVIFLSVGFYMIRKGNKVAHRNAMISAFVTSSVFLASYLTYHIYWGRTEFRNPAWFRPIYLILLLTHTILAIVVVPMILISLSRAWRERWELHKKIARWTWPVWMYVSITGVVIYLLLYQIFPQK
ncbi:MAG: DUF420 domain-containing protein [Verrucomicrobia bacterium]|nr:MAG: DUF420 domain-containing protein [Verrucomicrobiota bacterium]